MLLDAAPTMAPTLAPNMKPTKGLQPYLPENMARKAWAWKNKPGSSKRANFLKHIKQARGEFPRRQRANFLKRIKQLQPDSVHSMYSPEKQADMLIPLHTIKDQGLRTVLGGIALHRFLTQDKKIFAKPDDAMVPGYMKEMHASHAGEGYLYYNNMQVGCIKYALHHGAPTTKQLFNHILSTIGTEGMMRWIKMGFA